MFFIAILILTTLSIAGSAAFFSIYGLAQIFTGSFWPVVVMATSLEAGKLVAASYTYRYWHKLTFALKSYLLSAVFILMVITSAGIFGFLSAAYQQDILPLEQNQQRIELLQEEREEIDGLKAERLERRKQIDTDIASLPNNFVTGRQRLMKSYGPELEQIREDIATYTNRVREITLEVQQLKSENLETEAHIGPIIFIAEAFKSTTDQATKWVIILIIFAFDPLAVVLTIGANIAIIERKGGRGFLFGNTPPKAGDVELKVSEDDPEPLIINQGMSVEDLEKVLDERFSEHDKLSPEQHMQRAMIEETLAKKRVTQKIRTGR